MKFIIKGKTYNTDTATLAAEYTYDDDRGREVMASIYRTRAGDWFIVHCWSDRPDDEDWAWSNRAEAISGEGIERIKQRHSLEVKDSIALEAAEEEDSEEVAVYIRVNKHLKEKMVKAADGKSLNAWATKVFAEAAKA